MIYSIEKMTFYPYVCKKKCWREITISQGKYKTKREEVHEQVKSIDSYIVD